MVQVSIPRSATARSPWFLVRYSIASQMGRPLHGWRSQSPNDTGSPRKRSAHFLMQMAVLWTRPIEDALNCLEAAIRSVGENGQMVYACFNRQHRLTDLMARGDPLDQVWLESASALDFVRKYKFGQLVILSI